VLKVVGTNRSLGPGEPEGTRCDDGGMGEMITLQDGELEAYVAEPAGTPRGGLILIHEIWGLVDHITKVADRLAAEGYLVVAPDILSHAGISPDVGEELLRLRQSADPDEQSRLQPMMREKMAPLQSPDYAAWAAGALRRVVDHLAEQPGVEGRIGVLGFCFGGSYSFALAAADPRIRVAVPFYGHPPEQSTLADIAGPVLAFYGENDTALMERLPELTDQMKAAGVDFEAKVYENAGHAFFNDSNPRTYVAEAAADAWRRTLDKLGQNLG
jgi:carboxymethylenebutenolidase